MKRIIIVGTSGSGKTTLAKALAQTLRIPHIELDALHWEPDWREAEREVFCQRVETATQQDAWVCDGNYGSKGARELLWGRADTLVWLDYSRWVVLGRITKRTLSRAITRAPMWHNNRETWRRALSKDSMIVWAMQTYNRRKREFPALLQQPQYAHLQVFRFITPQDAEEWLRRVSSR